MQNLSIETLTSIMNITVYVFVFLFGITIGSFLNVCIYRLPKGESLITNNSHCMTCGTEIKRYDLIPVLSWLILRGKCRACGAKITPRYMIIEAMTGFIFLGIFARYPIMDWGYYPAVMCLFICGLIVLCFQDIDNQEMCVSVLIYTAIIAAAEQTLAYFGVIVLPESNLKDGLLGMCSVSVVLLVFGFVLTPLFYVLFVSEERAELRRLRKELKNTSDNGKSKKLTDKIASLEAQIKEEPPVFGFGMGDVVLMAAGGLMLGLKATVTAGLIAIFLGAIYGIFMKLKNGGDEESSNAFAFGPFLIIGLLIAAFINGSLIDLYISRFLIVE